MANKKDSKNNSSILNNIRNQVRANSEDNFAIDKIVNSVTDTINNKLNDNFKKTGEYISTSLYDKVNINDRVINPDSLYSINENNKIVQYDKEIDILLKNMPILETAIDLKRDNILPGDSLGQDYLSFKNLNKQGNDKLFDDNIEYIKEKYDIINLIDNTFINMCKYGEVFHHIIDYKSVVGDLIDKSKEISLNENVGVYADDITKLNHESIEIILSSDLSIYTEAEIISSNIYLSEAARKTKRDKKNKEERENGVIRGAVLRTLKHENVIPIYINDTCLGYYYIEINANLNKNQNYCYKKNINSDTFKKELATMIAKSLNEKFIRNNHSYSNDIYNILKYVNDLNNQNINVIYIKPDNMIHWYFKKCNKSHRGVSDLDRSLVPAKSWMLLNNAYKFGIIARSHDKRIYYVKVDQSDANIGQIVNKAISELTRTNSGLSNWSSIASIANFSGMFNDIVAPVGTNGEAAIQFDTLPGQNIEINNEFLEAQEKQAIESLEIPYEYVKSAINDIDFATRLNQSHGKFITHCLKRQSILEPHISKLITLLYRYEFGDENIKVAAKLAPPITFKTVTNTSIIESQSNFIELISQIWCDPGQDDNKLRLWKKHYIKNILAGYVNINDLDKITEASNIEYGKLDIKLKAEEGQNEG